MAHIIEIPLPAIGGILSHHTLWLCAAGLIALLNTRYKPQDTWAQRGYALLGFIVGGANLGAGVQTLLGAGSWFTAALHIIVGIMLAVHVALAFQPDLILAFIVGYLVFTNFPVGVFENPYLVLNADLIARIHLVVTFVAGLVVYALAHAVRHMVDTATALLRANTVMQVLALICIVEGLCLLLFGTSIGGVVLG